MGGWVEGVGGGGILFLGLWLPLCVDSDPGPIPLLSARWTPYPMMRVMGAISNFSRSASLWGFTREDVAIFRPARVGCKIVISG